MEWSSVMVEWSGSVEWSGLKWSGAQWIGVRWSELEQSVMVEWSGVVVYWTDLKNRNNK